ncbi:MAG: peptidylprolyl isomerase [Pseudomonadota bacterium]
MRFLFLSLVLAGVFAFAPSSVDARSESIAVVVNQDAITMSDVHDRMGLIIASSGLRNNQDTRTKLIPQVVGSLVDEQIRLQEAQRLDLGVTRPEIDQGFATIAQNNNMAPEEFRKMINQGGVNIATLESQIRSQIAWSKVVQSELRPQIIVSDNDVDNYLDRLRSNTGKPEYLVSEIFLPLDDPKNEGQTRQLAQKLVSEVRSGKAPFFRIAQQFSKSAGAPQGGDLGWVGQGQLQREVDAALPTIGKDQVSDPIRTSTGFHIINVRDERIMMEDTLPARDEVRSMLGTQRLERLQRRYLLDLKSTAFIENRLGF